MRLNEEDQWWRVVMEANIFFLFKGYFQNLEISMGANLIVTRIGDWYKFLTQSVSHSLFPIRDGLHKCDSNFNSYFVK